MAEVTDCCPRCGAPLGWRPSTLAAPEAAAPADDVETAPAAVSGTGELPAWVRRHGMLSLVVSLLLYMAGVLVLNTTPQHTALHGAAGACLWIGLLGAFVFVVLVGAGQEVRPSQLGWAAVPVVSVGYLAFVPFAWLAVTRRRARDWAVLAAYLAAVAAFAVAASDAGGSDAAFRSATVLVGGLVVIGPVHALLALGPAAGASPWRRADAAGAAGRDPEPVMDAVAVRRGAAYAGSGLALLASIVGFISDVIFSTGDPSGTFTAGPVIYLVTGAVAIAALCGITRLVVVGLLQGLCWPAAALAVVDIASIRAGIAGDYSGSFLAAYWIGIASDVLGAAAAVLLAVAWAPAVQRRRAAALRPLSAVLLVGLGSGQVAAWVFYATNLTSTAVAWTLGIAPLLVGVAITWYALHLRASAPGGALILGWAAVQALFLLPSISRWTVAGGAGCVLLVTVMILALGYMRGPAEPHRRPDGARI